jgi:hypothetical protein
MADTLIYERLLGAGRRISRRDFFQTVGVAVAGSVLFASGIEQLGATPARLAAPVLARSAFARHVGDVFRIAGESAGVVALELFKVRDLRSARSQAVRGRVLDPERSFSILFRGPADRALDQATYEFEHDRMGRFGLFIAPMRPEQDSRYYEAIFN